MYHDNYEREQIEAFAESLRSGTCIKKVLVSEENTSFFLMCLTTMHDTTNCFYDDSIDNLAKLFNKEIGEYIAYAKTYMRFNRLYDTYEDDNFKVFFRMLRYISTNIKDCYEYDTELHDYDNYYNGYKDAMFHIIDAFVYAYDIEFA